jgi:hypothetical protein
MTASLSSMLKSSIFDQISNLCELRGRWNRLLILCFIYQVPQLLAVRLLYNISGRYGVALLTTFALGPRT